MNDLLTVMTTTPGAGFGGLAFTVFYIVALIGIFYFFMIRPQKKQQKAHQVLISTVAAGDSILTSSGFYGVVIDVTDDVVIVEFGSNKNCRIPMKRDAIVEVEKAESNEISDKK